ncbi:ABC transporter C family protein [Tieghemostelium lacteum]|uniref:ABC transporter C family protein n=1 Tax=Tieghemostelium lacteum TaxID=361077 RepID=A0A151Z557_TIELA|nr:ABC transporter C family protein [Tieghemostelium lacteum]|eukprot:KYQ88934.1 ABC transporter C family protein [Tieghemostelium lacteum]
MGDSEELEVFLQEEDVNSNPLKNTNTDKQQEHQPHHHKEKIKTFTTNPEKNANIFSILTHRYLNPLLEVGVKRTLEFEDMYPILERDKSLNSFNNLKKYWKTDSRDYQYYSKSNSGSPTNSYVEFDDLDMDKPKSPKPSLVKALAKSCLKDYLIMAIYRTCADVIEFVIPLILYYFINFLQDPEIPIYIGIIYAIILMCIYMIDGFLQNYWLYKTHILSNQIRSCLISIIYEKSLLISSSVRGKESKGNIINLMTVDVDRIREFLDSSQFLISLPLKLILSFVFLTKLLGWSSVIGFSTLVLVLPINTYLGVQEYKTSQKVMDCKDVRTSKVTEAVHNIRILKFYGWVNLMKERIMQLRLLEVTQLNRQMLIWAWLYFFWFFIPDIVIIVTFGTVPMFPKVQFTLDTIVPALALFAITKFPLSLAPYLISGFTTSLQSVRRIEKFLLSEELVKPEIDERTQMKCYGGKPASKDNIHQDTMIQFRNSLFKWSIAQPNITSEEEEDGDKESDKSQSPPLRKSMDKSSVVEKEVNVNFQLEIGDLELKSGSLNIVIGPLASGKSSLISSIIGDMKLEAGQMMIRDRKVAYVSQLSWVMNATIRDNILFGTPYDHDRYNRVLDQCCLLSDLDMLPGRDQCEIGERGVTLSGGQNQRIAIARAIYSNSDILLLDDPLASLDVDVAQQLFRNAIVPQSRDKMVLLVTHQLFTLEHASQIIQLDGGKLIKCGKFEEFSIDTLEETYRFQKEEKSNNEKESSEKEEEDEVLSEYTESENSDEGKLVHKEDRNRGKVKKEFYKKYLGFFGYQYIAVIIFPPACSILATYWITYWAEQWDDPNHKSLAFYLCIYLMLSFCQSFGTFVAKYISFLNGIKASQRIHNQALEKVMRSPIQFFDQNLSGRIINRFSRDLAKLDVDIPESLSGTIEGGVQVIACLIFIMISAPLVLVLIIPFGYALYRVQHTYISNIREVQRLKNISLSPIISHFSETLTGQQIIRAFGASKRFFLVNTNKIDQNIPIELLNNFIACWSDIRLVTMGSSLIFFTALSGALLRNTISPSLIGLAINYCITLSGDINWLNSKWAMVETDMNAVERLDHYCKLSEEKPDYNRDINLSNWPSNGEIKFDNYTMKYREELPPSLKNITAVIPGHSKVGIVGRTGAGKSSLTQALFRLIEASEGRILIDGIDISQVGLMDLRQRMSIIPQNPVLFSGTLRYNLDPFSLAVSDYEIWEILKKLNSFNNLPEGLDTIVNEDSSNFSVGEKQLICLARALLRKSKIIVMDEASSAIDNENDQLIQQTIKKEFKNSTVVTIAHRLNTVIDYDWIIQMNDGRIEKFGRPRDILTKDNALLLDDNSTESNSSSSNSNNNNNNNKEE